MKHALLYFLGLLCLAAGVPAQGEMALPAPPRVNYAQRTGVQLPLQEAFTDQHGRAVILADIFDGKPVALVFGYYRCPNLCSTLMQGVLEALMLSGLDDHAIRVVEIGVDAAETPAMAAAREAIYRSMPGGRDADLVLLTGEKAAIDAAAQAAGLRYAYDAAASQYAHPAGFLIATTEGRISRYFMGVRFAPEEVRKAAAEASVGRIGSQVERLLLMCSHYDPAVGRYSIAAMAAVKLACLMVLAVLACWMLRQRLNGGGR